jgi:hypothetical protein
MSTSDGTSQCTAPVTGSSELIARGCQMISCLTPACVMMVGWL